jgi:glycosyltransferase involved in cell wall biosynthesis
MKADLPLLAESESATKAPAEASPAIPPAPPTVGCDTLIVSHATGIGGAEIGLLDLVRHLGPRCDVVLLSDGALRRVLQRQGTGVRLLQAGRTFHGVRRGGGALRALMAVPHAITLAIQLAAIARRHRLVYANSQKAAFVAMLAGVLARRPVIWHLHDILSAEHFAWPQRCTLARLSNHLARTVIVVSDAARRAYIESGGRPARVRVVYNGIDPTPYQRLSEQPRTALRSALGLPQGRLVGLFGRITEWKGQRVLIEALAALPGVQALIVGSAMFGEDAEEAHLKALADRLGVAGRVHFLGQRADVPALMRAVDAVVHCSTSPEPFGRVIVEALLAGTPVLAADAGASREILGDSDWLVTPDDPAALAAAIGRVLADTATGPGSQLARLRARVEDKFLLPHMMAAIDRIIGEAA